MLHFIRVTLIVLIVLISSDAYSQDPFITVWDTSLPGSSNTSSITIPTISSLAYNYDVDWDNDGVYEQKGITGDVTHDFGSEGRYTIRIRGDFPAIQFNELGDRRKLLQITQWGDIAWENMNSAFEGCVSLNITATDTPNLTGVSSMSQMFKGAINFTGDLSDWDVSSVLQMVGTFQETNAFNSDISGWDISNCMNINSMFFEAIAFNQDISGWHMSQLSELRRVFSGASSFDQDLGEWDVTSVSDMTDLFNNSGMTRKNYDRTLIGWSELPFVQANVNLGANDLFYCNGSNARNTFIQPPFEWNISGDQEDCIEADFITVWETTSANTSVELYASCLSGYNYDVDWDNDGEYDAIGIRDDISFDYGAAGIRTIRIRGAFPCFSMYPDSRPLLKSVAQWGEIKWSNMANMFSGTGLETITALDAPDLSSITSLHRMFEEADNFDGPIGHWDVSSIVDMSFMFKDASSFNQSLTDWDVSQVTDMSFMFLRSSSFNQPLNEWELLKAESISSMFNGATSFNQPLDEWDVSNVTNMISAFLDATSFNQSLSDWDISNVEMMASMLINSGLSMANYDETLRGWSALSTKQNDVDLGATNLEYCEGEAARQTLIDDFNWNITGDFRSCPFITKWKTDNPGGSPTRISIQISETGYNYDVDWENDGIYDDIGVTATISHDYGVAGEYEVAIRGDFPRIPFSSTESNRNKILEVVQWGDVEWSSMLRAFFFCPNLRITASDSPDLTVCSDFSDMFQGASSFNDPIEHWDISAVTDMINMFHDASSFNQPLNAWGPHIADVTSLRSVFAGATSFNQSLSDWNVSNVTSLSSLFSGATSYNQSLNNWDVSSVTDLRQMFQNATDYNQPMNNWATKVENVEELARMFSGASSFNQNLADWQTVKLTNIEELFENATSFNGSLDNWQTSLVTEMRTVFSGATSFNQSLDTWDVSQVDNFEMMFHEATSFNESLDWNTESLEDANNMFAGAVAFNQPLNWNTSNLKYTARMFSNATSFDQNLGSWDVSNLSSAEQMLDNSGLSTTNYDLTLIGWSGQTLKRLDIGVEGLLYCDSYEARTTTLPNQGWRFIGDDVESLMCNPNCGNEITIFQFDDDWYEEPNIWSLGAFPTLCDNVIIPDGLSLLLRQSNNAEQNEGLGSTLEIQVGASVEIQAGAVLTIIPFDE